MAKSKQKKTNRFVDKGSEYIKITKVGKGKDATSKTKTKKRRST